MTPKRCRFMPTPKKPALRSVTPEKIPSALRKLPHWVDWRLVPRWQKDRTVKFTKVPFMPNGACASSTDAKTWSTFDQALAAYEAGLFDGIGFVTAGVNSLKRFRDPFVLIDLDHARDLATGEIAPWAADIIAAAHAERAYIELSPSRAGFHIIGVGPQGFAGQKANNVEIYSDERFFTITGGLAFNPRQRALGTLDKTLQLVAARIGIAKPVETKERKKPPTPAPIPRRPYAARMTDDDILAQAFASKNGAKLQRLLDGDLSDYGGDASSADLAAAAMLAFWFWLDPEAIERVMLESNLARDKWESMRGKRTYLRYTIEKALVGKEEYFGRPAQRLPSLDSLRQRRLANAELRA